LNTALISLLDSAMGCTLTPTIAMAICDAARELPTLVRESTLSRISPERREDCVFSLERMEDVIDEMKPLHLAHWNETEEHRHGLPFNPDYETFIRYEQAGRYVLFTLRIEGRLMGNCAMYLDNSAHTQTLIATEDTLYFLPEARRGTMAKRFIRYCENALKQIGVMEICVTVKTVNKAGRLFQMLGYRHVENGLTKILESENV
jgi:N-acetylglutamate synthase-like GNAT family acetyltransferase